MTWTWTSFHTADSAGRASMSSYSLLTFCCLWALIRSLGRKILQVAAQTQLLLDSPGISSVFGGVYGVTCLWVSVLSLGGGKVTQLVSRAAVVSRRIR
ncbi:hypothetical protein B0H12DRAFT_167079 [Mycena haematopus]|nr:hypothetical protein B0H12DRAFT_167079 [Mycena haematopus]